MPSSQGKRRTDNLGGYSTEAAQQVVRATADGRVSGSADCRVHATINNLLVIIEVRN